MGIERGRNIVARMCVSGIGEPTRIVTFLFFVLPRAFGCGLGQVSSRRICERVC